MEVLKITVILNLELKTVTTTNFGGLTVNYINLENIILIKIRSFITGGKK